MDTSLLAVAVGVGVGVVVGALGAGGGILAVPALVYLLGQEPHDATASSLFIVALTALASIGHHVRRGNVAWRAGGAFAVCSVLGAVAGSRASVLVPGDLLLLLFAALLAVVAVQMARRGLRLRADERPRGTARASASPAPPPAGVPAEPIALPWPRVIATATVTGVLTGFFGVGGGFIVVPMLVLALGLTMRRAAGTSLLVMVVATAVSLLSRVGTDVHVDWVVTLLFAAGSMAGGVLGGPLSDRARASTLTLAFAALLGAVAVVTLAQSLPG